MTPLHWAANRGHLDIVQALLKARADVNAKDEYGMTPLHLAAIRGHLGIIQALLKAGADVNAKDEDEYTPLHLAAARGHLDIVQALIEARADDKCKRCKHFFGQGFKKLSYGYCPCSTRSKSYQKQRKT